MVIKCMEAQCIRWLCELFPEIIEKRNEDSLTALHIVVTENNIDALKILLEFKTDLETVDNNGHTALHFAVDYGHTDCVLTLLNSGSLVNCQDVSGATPLHYAINAGSQDDDVIIKQLLKFGASTSLADRNGRLPLHWAANYGNPTVCVSMVENGSPVNSRCNDGHTALHIAASHGHEECIRVLITKCGADMNIEDKFGYTPLFNAIITRHVQCAKLLLQHKALPNHKDTKGNSAAHLAASKGLIEVLQELVHHQGSHEHRNNAGDLPLHEAALFQRLDIVKHIITSRCEVDVRNNQGLTPLHLCASVGSIAVCECLLKGGADINCINTQCKNGLYKFLTPLDLARMNKHAECVNYLQINGGRSGERMTTAASRKIQRWWKARRPPKIALGSNREYAEECSEEMMEATQDTLERSTEEYVTQTENTGGRKEDEEPSRHKQGDDLNDQINGQECDCRNRGNPHRQIEANLDQNSSLKNSAENADNALKRAEETSTLDVEGDELETTFPEKNEIEVHTPAKTMEPSVDLPENQQDCGVVPKQADQKENVDGIRTKTASKLETRQAIKQRLKESLEKEKLRKEKLSEEIERLKNDLEDRCLRLEKRLGAIQQNLKKL
ncbi:ankyrin repeat, PH and SEC7 domain containing protein secG-like isoform X2 [Dendronephthya gigantea]|uniref:ankyrin repeat, PH and SEC7 domain containing protein secG-like isoform X2 n=1 Tax=Dendronephthya gigantea TaxID=151771 RepID=UPI00106BE785|nr:ankyrin repeat, PH and SEC7 domain containing protein secG-like isoform X2 [Dendronephthya gigantea]